MSEKTSIREKVCDGATKSALSWLAQCDRINGSKQVDKLLASLHEIGASLNDFFLVLVFSFSDNIHDVFEQVRRTRKKIGSDRALHYDDVVDDEGTSIFVN